MARIPGTTPGAIPPDHVQSGAAATWNITHNLGRLPQIVCVDNSGEVLHAEVTVTTTTATIVHSTAKTGRAIIR